MYGAALSTTGIRPPSVITSPTRFTVRKAEATGFAVKRLDWMTKDSGDVNSVGVILRQSGVATAAFVERLAPEDLWALFQRVGPPAPERPQGGGHRRRGDREVLAAIIFVAPSGCTWNQLPPDFGLSGVIAFRRFTEWSEVCVWTKLHRLVLDDLGSRGGLDCSRCAIDSVSVRASKGAADQTESDRPR